MQELKVFMSRFYRNDPRLWVGSCEQYAKDPYIGAYIHDRRSWFEWDPLAPIALSNPDFLDDVQKREVRRRR